MTTRTNEQAVEKLAAALRIATVAAADGGDVDPLLRWQALMVELFPAVHATLEYSFPDPWQMVYRWEPASASRDAAPILLMAHYDVVPADPHGWSVKPFGGTIRDGAVWGRGALDNKLSHIAILQAIEELVAAGFSPSRPIYLAFGGDEETGGRRGAAAIARAFARDGVRFAMVLDEGAAVARDIVPSVRGATGLIGCAEKGHINVRVSATGGGGHASNPPRIDGITRLSHALARIMRTPLPAQRTATTTEFIQALGRTVGGLQGWMLRHYPYTAPLIHRALRQTPQTDAMIRTTHVPTMLSGSDAPNVLPREAHASVNIRLLPGERMDSVVAELRRRAHAEAEAHAEAVTIALTEDWDNNEAPPESPASGYWYSRVAAAIRTTWGDIPVLPYLVTATTDSRHYVQCADAIYRFVPMELTSTDLAGIHGVDEHVSIENITRAVRFYRTLIMNEASQEEHHE